MNSKAKNSFHKFYFRFPETKYVLETSDLPREPKNVGKDEISLSLLTPISKCNQWSLTSLAIYSAYISQPKGEKALIFGTGVRNVSKQTGGRKICPALVVQSNIRVFLLIEICSILYLEIPVIEMGLDYLWE